MIIVIIDIEQGSSYEDHTYEDYPDPRLVKYHSSSYEP